MDKVIDELHEKYNPHTLWVFHQLNKFKGGNNMPNLINSADKAIQVITDAWSGWILSSRNCGKTILQQALEYAVYSMKRADAVEDVLREWYADDSVLPDCNYYMNKIREIYDANRPRED